MRGEKRWEEHRPYFERALAGETVQYTRLVQAGRGRQRWVRTSYVPDFDASGDVVGIYTVSIDVHELTIARERLQRSVERDALTDVLSRRTIMARLEGALPHAAGRTPVALFFVDLDGFKEVNDGSAIAPATSCWWRRPTHCSGGARRGRGRPLRRRRVPGAGPVARVAGAQRMASHLLEPSGTVAVGPVWRAAQLGAASAMHSRPPTRSRRCDSCSAPTRRCTPPSGSAATERSTARTRRSERRRGHPRNPACCADVAVACLASARGDTLHTLMAGILVLTGFALVLDWIVGLVEKRLMKWQPRSGETEKI